MRDAVHRDRKALSRAPLASDTTSGRTFSPTILAPPDTRSLAAELQGTP
jgi:hypothetical protein